MEEEEGHEDDGPRYPWLPPEDRIWRHPSELAAGSARPADLGRRTGPPLAANRAWTTAMAAGLVGALVASGLFVAAGHLAHRTTTVIESVTTSRSSLAAGTSATSPGWPAIAKDLASSVVGLTVRGDDGTVQGSAVLYADGTDVSYLLSASDLLGGGGSASVLFDDGVSVPAKLVGADPTTGLALLSVRSTRRYYPAVFGSVATVAVAQSVLAVGAPVGSDATVGTGSVSGVDDTVSADGSTWSGLLAVSGPSPSPAADGGAIVDQQGDVVGIEAGMSSVTDQDGLTYAVPIDVAEQVADEIMTGRRLTHPWLGIEDATDLSAAAAGSLDVDGGAEVGQVEANSPAAEAGLQADDVVTGFAGHAVTSSGVLTMLLARSVPGRRALLAYRHHGLLRRVVVVVGDQPLGG